MGGFRNLSDNHALAEYHALRRWNAFCPKTGKYLHMSGTGVTDKPMAAWVGSRLQFNNLKLANGKALAGFTLRKVSVERKQAVFN